ncbi:murein biosynthesis protein MurJ [Corynebacterium alimapuense]|uniref:Murein biosynthesis protein MurJ n=2 Tax=Corynebacterium alimapuense TaxID=1576874 RepID=A0A3M8K4X2_9CORY|nr:murein biosynthesis protein MurJ [Corynebacterium alimapuense]
MAIATLISRMTGFLRNLLIGAALGPAVASAFNTANTLPNLITEIVLGAVLTSLVVPVLIRAEKEDPDKGAAFFRRLFTLSATLLIVVTLISVAAASLLTRLALDPDGRVNVVQSTSFAFLLLPQIFFYGIFALFMAVLNTKGVFKPGAWAPVANNVVSIAVLIAYWTIPGSLDPNAPAGLSDPHVLLLGLGTTLGVVVQTAIMLPSLRRAGIDLRPLWGIDTRLKQFGKMAVAIIVYVAISQAGYLVTTRIASVADAAAPIIYQQAWLLLQVPYGIIGVTLLTAIMPRLSRNAADGDDKAVVGDLNLAAKLTFIALIPVVVFFTAFGPQIGNALFAYGAFDPESATLLGLTLSSSAFTLLPYALVLLHLRVFYAREEAWTPTLIIAGITATKILLSMLAPLVADSPSRVVILLGAANGFGFLAGAVIGSLLLRRKLGNLGVRSLLRTTLWAAAASLIGIAVALLADFFLLSLAGTQLQALGSIGFLLRMGLVGVVFLIITGIALSFSRLPEVQNLGRALGRIPGLSRFIHPNTDREIKLEQPTDSELSSQLLAMDSFNSSPVPPPMSAGVVRGPRLVPGAPVSDGRFRLLADHGSVPGARFWQAQELATGRKVALTFVDTTGNAPLAPATPAAAAGVASEVSRRTRKLADLEHSGIATGIEVLAYRSGCLIVADWVPGSPLKTVAEEDGPLDPQAIALAVAPLADAAAAAHAAKTPLGLDNRARIRISTDGAAILAFPAVLVDSSVEADRRSVASTLALLASSSSGLNDLVSAAREKDVDMQELAHQLWQFGGVKYGEQPVEEMLVVEAEPSPHPSAQPGFGSKSYSGKMTALIALLAIGAVMLVASLTVSLTSLFSNEADNSPGLSETIQDSQTGTITRPLPIVQPLSSASDPEVADNEQETTWSTDDFPDGVVLNLQDLAYVERVLIQTTSEGASFEIYAIPANTEPSTVTGTAGLSILAEGIFRDGRNNIEFTREVATDGILVWITDPADGESSAEITEVQVIGRNEEAGAPLVS